MLISLYRRNDDHSIELQMIFDLSGEVVVQRVAIGVGQPIREEWVEFIGPLDSAATDESVAGGLGRALADGYRVLYGFVPPGSLWRAGELLGMSAGIDVVPDLTDGVPFWETIGGERAAHPSYLLFTALSSETK